MPRTAKKTHWVIWLRRAVQTACLLLFFYLFVQTALHGLNETGGPVTLFFELDPLILAVSWLATRVIIPVLLLSLATLLVTALFGRWFCGWICPFGVLHNIFSSWRGGKLKARLDAGGHSPHQRWKYLVLVALLVGSFFGANLAGWLDPFSFFYRSLATSIYPAFHSAAQGLFTWLYDKNPGVGSARITAVSEPVYSLLKARVLVPLQPHYHWGVLIGALFVAIVALNFYRARFWCRYVCPLGALLGVAGKNPLVRLKKSETLCNDCRLCVADCPGGADPHLTHGWKPAECFFCWNCESACPHQAISFEVAVPRHAKIAPHFAPWRWLVGFFNPPQKAAQLDLSRRALLTASAAGLGGALLFDTHPFSKARSFNPGLIRPPGSTTEAEFLSRCVRCGECMKICPTNAIHPTLFEAGIEGMWSPQLKMNLGYCEYECTLCGQVCPTDAIRELPIAEKQQTRIGLAFFDKNRCLPYAFAKPCIVCEEHCPTPKKAIWFLETEVVDEKGQKVVVKQPHVNPDLCIGCGICQNKCPVKDQPAVYVTSVGESRNPANQILLASSPGAF